MTQSGHGPTSMPSLYCTNRFHDQFMLKLPPPIWTLIYIIISATISWLLDWPTPPGLPLPLLGITLVAVAFIAPVWAFVLFRREGTEIDPTSPTNRKLVTSGPYQFTRNPMYLGLVILTLGVALWVGAWPMFFAPSPSSPPLIGSTSLSRKPRCAVSSEQLMKTTLNRCGAGCETRHKYQMRQ